MALSVLIRLHHRTKLGVAGMDEPVMTAQELHERTVPDAASVAAIVAMAMRMRSDRSPSASTLSLSTAE